MQQTTTILFQCSAQLQAVRVHQVIQWVHVVGEDTPLHVVLSEVCARVRHCPTADCCPLLAND